MRGPQSGNRKECHERIVHRHPGPGRNLHICWLSRRQPIPARGGVPLGPPARPARSRPVLDHPARRANVDPRTISVERQTGDHRQRQRAGQDHGRNLVCGDRPGQVGDRTK